MKLRTCAGDWMSGLSAQLECGDPCTVLPSYLPRRGCPLLVLWPALCCSQVSRTTAPMTGPPYASEGRRPSQTPSLETSSLPAWQLTWQRAWLPQKHLWTRGTSMMGGRRRGCRQQCCERRRWRGGRQRATCWGAWRTACLDLIQHLGVSALGLGESNGACRQADAECLATMQASRRAEDNDA